MSGVAKLRVAVLLLAAVLVFCATTSIAQEFPAKPINLMISSFPGGLPDIQCRVLASKVEKFLGQPIVITNNAAGGGTVSLNLTAKAKPDGYNVLTISTGHLFWLPHVRVVTYKIDEFIPVMQYSLMESGMVVKADSPWKTAREFIDYAKKNPGKVTYASTGVGVPMEIAMRYVAKQEGIQWTHVPAAGTNPSIMLLGGHVSVITSSTSFLPYVRSGQLRLLAVHSAKRMKEFPDVPTFRELGYDFVHESANVLVVPKGTPLPVVAKLDAAFKKALEDKECIDTIEKMGTPVLYRSHEELVKDFVETGKLVDAIMKKLNITPEPEGK